MGWRIRRCICLLYTSIQLDNPKGEDGKVLTITNVCKVARVTGEALPGESIYNPNNTGSDFDEMCIRDSH